MGSLLIEDTTLFDGTGAPPNHRMSVMISDGIIRAVGRPGSFRAPSDSETINAKGRFVMPGLVDLHTHMVTREAFRFLKSAGGRMREGDEERFLRWFPAFGVTTVRDIGNYSGILRLRNHVSSGRLIGPTILAAGELLEGPKAYWPLSRTFRTPVQAEREVRRQASMGFDWVKLYISVTPALARTAIREAHRLRLPVAGHLFATTPRQAAGYGIDSLEHIGTLIDKGFLPTRWREKLPTGKSDEDFWTGKRMLWLHSDLDGPAARELIRNLRDNNVVVSPTMIVFENVYVGSDPEFVRYGLSPMPERWKTIWRGRLRGWGVEKISFSLQGIWQQMLKLVRRLRKAGVTLIPGTDAAGWNPFVAPGASLHRELAILRECGYSNRELLAMATSGAARALRHEWEFGTVAPGKRADLLLLKRNPLEDLANLRSIETVFLRGNENRPEELRP